MGNELDTNIDRKHKIFYGWWIVVSGFLFFLIAGGLTIYGFGVFFTPLEQEFGWSRARLSGAMTMMSLVGLLAPMVGKLIDKYGAKIVLVFGAAVTGGASALLALTNNVWYFYAMYIFNAVGHLGVLHLPCLSMVANWFVKRRGLAIGITVTGLGFGGTLMAPLVTSIILANGWRFAYVITGVVVCAALIPLALLVVKNRPEDKGLTPYGKTAEEARNTTETGGEQWTLSKALRSRTFWLVTTALTLGLIGPASLVVHLIPSLIDRGISAQNAAAMLGCATGVSIVGRILIGYLADRLPIRFVAIMFFFLEAVGILLLLTASSMASLWVFAVIFGLAMGGLFTLEALLIDKYFGLSAFGAIFGALWAFEGIAFAGAPLLTGRIFDVTGSYTVAYIAFIGTALGAIIIAFLVGNPAPEPPAASSQPC